jgi:DNA-binding transcriptional ArsR family regulator
MLNEKDDIKQQVIEDLQLMYKAGLVDIKMREDGQWVYFATEYSKSLSDEQLNEILFNLHLDYGQDDCI